MNLKKKKFGNSITIPKLKKFVAVLRKRKFGYSITTQKYKKLLALNLRNSLLT